MRFIIVTGMSGAGKSTALKILEDTGYYRVDNLPVELVPKLGELLLLPGSSISRIALGLDIRSGHSFEKLQKSLEQLDEMKISYEILFLEASDETLIKRYKETRRSHPLAGNGRVDQGITEERKRLAFLKRKADYLIDTSRLLTRELREEMHKIFIENKEYKICTLRFFLSVSSTVCQVMRIWCLMCVSFPIRIILMIFVLKAEMTRKCGIM